ncbi:MAG: RNA-binding transcriptional accessory protein [Anaerolineae bacterium]|nr:RNA-binding transcriptional accessory protein [Anaerolineae bacterium]
MEQEFIITAVSTDLSLDHRQVKAAVTLLDEGNTVPFVARYRKEVTGALDEEQLRQISERLAYRRNMEERRETILKSLESQDVLTPELQAAVTDADTLQRLEDLYRPYKPKRRTRATVAREKGLGPLADLILVQSDAGNRESLAETFLNDDVPSVMDAYTGARDIVAEAIADAPEIRDSVRNLAQRKAVLSVAGLDESKDPESLYKMYYDFVGDLRRLRPHQILAINRAEREGVFKLAMELPEPEALGILAKYYPSDAASPLADDLVEAREDGYRRLLLPAIEREMRRQLTEVADAHAIEVFATNLKSLLLQPPLRGQVVLGIDPGYRTGCKVAVVDATGKVLDITTIYPTHKKNQALEVLRHLVQKHGVTVIAIGNGTASRETEALVAEAIHAGVDVQYTIVNEAGASVYSASKLARNELPDLDVSIRGAVSIARRLQDPLAELVKIEPKAIGVGLYQHDVNQKQLAETLDVVVESAVNTVGADLNTASPALLQYVSGIGPKMAETIVAYRDEYGAFANRKSLLKVPGLGPKTFEQASGFLRVPDGKDLLDNTPIHPESYAIAKALLKKLGLPLGDPKLKDRINKLYREANLDELATSLGTGRHTLEDILDALARPGRDPRDELEGPVLRSDVLSIEDLREGMRLRGTVRNVVDFGAFVDIGVKRDGLIHISRMGSGYVHSPHNKVSVGDVVDVEVVEVDQERGRIGLQLIE